MDEFTEDQFSTIHRALRDYAKSCRELEEKARFQQVQQYLSNQSRSADSLCKQFAQRLNEMSRHART